MKQKNLQSRLATEAALFVLQEMSEYSRLTYRWKGRSHGLRTVSGTEPQLGVPGVPAVWLFCPILPHLKTLVKLPIN